MAETLWEHQVFVIGQSASMPGAIAALDIAFPCDDGSPRDAAHPEYYAAKYSANGQLPATHYGCAFVVTEPIRQNLESMGLDTTPGITYWRASNPEGILAASSLPADAAKVGEPWAWEDCLTSMGLQPVNEKI
jgi:hypothetical protein